MLLFTSVVTAICSASVGSVDSEKKGSLLRLWESFFARENPQEKELDLLVQSLQGQSVVLEDFFRTLFGSFSGYVLCGDKPICIEACPLNDQCSILSGIDDEWICIGL